MSWSRRVLAWLRIVPVTAVCVTTAGFLLVAAQIDQWLHPGAADDALRRWGAVTSLVVVGLPDLTGQFDLWNGEVWRILGSAFHHGGVLHLLMNAIALWFFGRLLEPKLGPLRFALFVLASAVVAFVPELLMEHSAIGLSGVVYALFGAILVVRRTDAHVARIVSDGVVTLGFVWLAACFVLTELGVVHVANAAHVAGLAYGWLTGWVFFRQPSVRRSFRFVFLVSHIVLVAGVYFVAHPVWLGRYHWYLAVRERDADRQTELLRRALEREPGLAGLWRSVALFQRDQGDVLGAWRTILNGLRRNRTDQQTVVLARLIWSEFQRADQRRTALQVMAQVFPQELADWREHLRIPPDAELDSVDSLAVEPRLVGEHGELRKLLQARSNDLKSILDEPEPWGRSAQDREPVIDPNSPDSASEGVTL